MTKSPEDMTDNELLDALLEGMPLSAKMEAMGERWFEKYVVESVAIAAANSDRTAKGMAEAVYAQLRVLAEASGHNPDIEVMIKRPGEPRHFADATCYVVAWEAGPYQWAIPASMAIGDEAGKLVEPYYSFDLCFYPSED